MSPLPLGSSFLLCAAPAALGQAIAPVGGGGAAAANAFDADRALDFATVPEPSAAATAAAAAALVLTPGRRRRRR